MARKKNHDLEDLTQPDAPFADLEPANESVEPRHKPKRDPETAGRARGNNVQFPRVTLSNAHVVDILEKMHAANPDISVPRIAGFIIYTYYTRNGTDLGHTRRPVWPHWRRSKLPDEAKKVRGKKPRTARAVAEVPYDTPSVT